ncbi:hypothetical protein D3C83_07100 [compost metagenome]
MIERLFHRYVGAVFPDRHHHLDLVVQVPGDLREGDGGAVRNDGVRRLHEKERRLALGVMPHLARVLGVVAADAIDAPHREFLVALRYRQGRRRPEIDRVFHLSSSFRPVFKSASR